MARVRYRLRRNHGDFSLLGKGSSHRDFDGLELYEAVSPQVEQNLHQSSSGALAPRKILEIYRRRPYRGPSSFRKLIDSSIRRSVLYKRANVIFEVRTVSCRLESFLAPSGHCS